MKHGIVKLKELEINLEELAEFIVKAKKKCYAGNGKKSVLPDGSKLLTFQEGNFHYIDNYSGFYQAPGSEVVRWQKSDGQKIWQMSYSGGMKYKFWNDEKLAKNTFMFLKVALLQVTPEKPFRGPLYFCNQDFIYKNSSKGDVTRFRGTEEIKDGDFKPRVVFLQDYIGGLVVPK